MRYTYIKNWKLGKTGEQRNTFQLKRHIKTPKKLNKLELSNLPKKVFKIMILKTAKEAGRIMAEQGRSKGF